ncbi:sialin-like, partial [Lytechinus variegatus]|uniref:sialin-like n=1 Tax=Lytechinus variegatus TaxID=7654 RepID=UPI001BB1D1BF
LAPPKDRKRWQPNSRMFFAFMCFWCVTSMDSLRINPSVAITAMAVSNHTKENASRGPNNSTHACINDGITEDADDTDIKPEFSWSSRTQELLLSAFFIGLPITQLPGGWLADRVGGKWVVMIGGVVTAAMNMLVPVAARTGAGYFFGVRLLAGLAEGTVVPAMFTLLGKWSTVDTNTRISSFALAGAPFGMAVGQTLSGLICSTPWLGWPFSFYILGSNALVWAMCWGLFIKEKPDEDTPASSEDVSHNDDIQQKQENNSKKKSYPIFKVLTSLPVYALIILRFSIHGWVVGTLLTNLPIFMKYILGFKVREVGLLASVPYICQMITCIITSQISDFLIGRGTSVTKVRKTSASIGAIMIAGSLIPVAFLVCNRYFGMALVIIATIGTGVAYPSVFSNTVDLAPRSTGTLYGISNTIGISASFISPMITGILIVDQYDPVSWRYVFYIASAITAFSAIFFHTFGSGEDQKWVKDDETEDVENAKEIELYSNHGYDNGQDFEI